MGKLRQGTVIWTIAGIAAFGAMIPNLERVAWLINAPKVAYAASDIAETTERDFDKFITVFEAQQQVQQAYYQQQMKQEQADMVRIERKRGKDYCCHGEVCWPWDKETGCR
jgi:hypothetical protein